jgi:hypothetical protein
MSTTTHTTQSLRQHLIETIRQVDEGHLTAAQALLDVLAMTRPTPLPKVDRFVPMPPNAETTPGEDAEFMGFPRELHDAPKS